MHWLVCGEDSMNIQDLDVNMFMLGIMFRQLMFVMLGKCGPCETYIMLGSSVDLVRKMFNVGH